VFWLNTEQLKRLGLLASIALSNDTFSVPFSRTTEHKLLPDKDFCEIIQLRRRGSWAIRVTQGQPPPSPSSFIQLIRQALDNG
jgi:hypothetical protein